LPTAWRSAGSWQCKRPASGASELRSRSPRPFPTDWQRVTWTDGTQGPLAARFTAADRTRVPRAQGRARHGPIPKDIAIAPRFANPTALA
jgi:hypothetical protein